MIAECVTSVIVVCVVCLLWIDTKDERTVNYCATGYGTAWVFYVLSENVIQRIKSLIEKGEVWNGSGKESVDIENGLCYNM